MNRIAPVNTALIRSAQASLAQPQKTLDAKWFYDTPGSLLFEQITDLPEYYPTRTEIGILKAYAHDIAACVPAGAAMVELGSGASVKTRLLLDALPALSTYVPVDISAAFLRDCAAALAQDYPALDVTPLAADFLEPLVFPTGVKVMPKVGFFPGSTIGNMDRDKAIELLGAVRKWPNVRGLILGIDLVKDIDRLIAAYNDAQGVTAAFNLNVLERLNREARAEIDVTAFAHEARWNADFARIEMHLVAKADTRFHVDGAVFDMIAGESIHSENSHKYTAASIGEMAQDAGWEVATMVTDAAEDFAVCVLAPV